MKIAVLMGGTSSEREISLKSGMAVARGLEKAGHEVLMLDLQDRLIMPLSFPSFIKLARKWKDFLGNPFIASANTSPFCGSKPYGWQKPALQKTTLKMHKPVPTTTKTLKETLKKRKADLVFIALHGKLGEDGTIQGLLEIVGMPYTGSGVLASALALDKTMSKKIFIAEGIPTAKFAVVTEAEFGEPEIVLEKVNRELKFPLVVKPAREGSTIGVSIVQREKDLTGALQLAFTYDNKALIEEYIQGKEITVGILGNENPTALPPIEIVSRSPSGFYDYEAKYVKDLSEHIIPPRISQAAYQLVCETALRAYKALGCEGFSRVDMILGEDETPYVLEVNTIPGFTETSLVPEAAKAAGIEFPELVDRIVKFALEKVPRL